MLKRKHLLLAATIVPIIIGLFVFAFYLCLSDTASAAGGNGLFARYFTTRNLSKQAFTRVDATVNFDWGSGSPGAGVSSDNFSVRWEGQVEALYSEQYTFYTTSDDGVRLWVNNKLLVDDWTNHASSDDSGSLKLAARQKYNIRLEYYENKGNANIKLGWSSPSQPRQVIPASQLFSAVSTTPGNTPTATPIPTSTPVRTTTTVPTTTAVPTTTVGVPTATPTTVPVPTGIWKPALSTTWQWQLDGTLNTTLSPLMYDIDLFDNTAADVQKLHAANHKAVCYISTGSWEDWRPDAALFPSQVLGRNYDGWPGERWLDIRQIDQLAPIMQKRLDLCKSKGFDGVEPDNIDAYTNNTGFPLTAQDQLKYNIWLANEAHARGLSIGLKNDNDQVKELLPYFDFAILEDCFDQGWCADFSPFVQAGKAVFAAEYTDTGMTLDKFCSKAKTLNFNAILKNRGLDAWLLSCN